MSRPFDPSHVDRIMEKVRRGDSETATYANVVFTSFRQADVAKRRKGKEGPIIRAIRRIVDVAGVRTFEDLLGALEDDDQVEDLYQSTSDPIDVHLPEIDYEAQTITFSIRNRPQPKAVTFKRLRNILPSL